MDIALKCGVVLLLFFAQSAIAFEGDYIWDERFKTNLTKAESGQAKDQYAMGEMYLKGRGTEIDTNKALAWFLRAAKQKYHRAAYKVAYLYLYDDTVERSPQRALRWLQQAAEAGFVPAKFELGKLYASGAAGQRNTILALKWLGEAKFADYKPARAEFARLVRQMVKDGSR